MQQIFFGISKSNLEMSRRHKIFSIVRDAAHLLTPQYKIEKGLCEMSTSLLRQKSV